MDRHWLLTSTTYGSWLPGDDRGFVGPTPDGQGGRTIHNLPGEPYDSDVPWMADDARARLKCPPIVLRIEHAEALEAQFHETAEHRGWRLMALAIMATHFHLVVGVPGDPRPKDILRDFKSYGSRRLNSRWGKPRSETWWTESGSTRKLPNEQAILAAIRYVRDQSNPLVVWVAEEFRGLL